MRRLIIIFLCAAVGWAVGFLRLPYIEKNQSFWVGFLGCAGFVSLIIALLLVWNKYALLIRIVGKDKDREDSRSARKTYRFIGVMTMVLVLSGWIFSGIVFRQETEAFKIEQDKLTTTIQEQTSLINSLRNENMGELLSNVLALVDKDIASTEGRTLSSMTIERIATLSHSFKPYRLMEGDSLSTIKRSPERGQLLLALSIAEMDSVSFEKIKQIASFAGSDLRATDLHGADLNGIDLQGADLTDANLMEVKLNDANLKGVKFWGANLSKADLQEANLKRCDLRWANMNGANFSSANMNGSDLANSQLIRAELQNATLRWTTMKGTILSSANLNGAELFGADLTEANLTDAQLSDVLFRRADLTDAILTGVELNKSDVEVDWFDKLNAWKTIGRREIQETHTILDVTPAGQETSIYHLMKIRQ